MSSDVMSDRLTIKDIIFTKALPNYKIPVPTDGYKIYPCTDCGDKFLFESSYNYHINRKSLKISYFCRHCMEVTIFYNRCKLLSHIRSHAFKTATITISDLKLEPLPLEHFDLSILPNTSGNQQFTQHSDQQITAQKNVCHECNQIITKHGAAYRDRAAHYMEYSKTPHSCPICMFVLPTVCALEAHLRIHLHITPYFCPECGVHLPNKIASYPFDHACKGFKMMKVMTRVICSFDSCKKFFHPDEYKSHFKTHLTKVYRCSSCLEIWSEYTAKCKLCKNGNISSYFRCPLCPNKIFGETILYKHLNTHLWSHEINTIYDQVYPCMACHLSYQHMYSLISHHVNKHASASLKNLLTKVLVKAEANSKTRKKGPNIFYHRVVKKCSKCLRSFTYKCVYDEIAKLPSQCPYKCSSNNTNDNSQSKQASKSSCQINCFLCRERISQNWADIKQHYAKFHKNHKCVDVKVLVEKLDKNIFFGKSNRRVNRTGTIINIKSKKNKVTAKSLVRIIEKKGNNYADKDIPRDKNVCIICDCIFENIENLESHMATHRDPCMAYQCLECGQSFVVKPSFSTHLLLEHGISDVKEYIAKKPCYNELALLKSPITEPAKENQCRICRKQFEDSNDLEKHFRVHGMAFLLKNANKNNCS